MYLRHEFIAFAHFKVPKDVLTPKNNWRTGVSVVQDTKLNI